MSEPLKYDYALSKRQQLGYLQQQIAEQLGRTKSPKTARYLEKALAKLGLQLQEPDSGPPKRPRETKLLQASAYARRPVGVREFVESDKFTGRVLQDHMFPRLVDDLEELFAGNYSEVCLGGSIGWGKTTFAVAAIAYELYMLSCLKDPAVAYGMKPGSNMTFVNVSVNVTQATNVFFKDLYDLVKSCPYFQRVFRFDHRLETSNRVPQERALLSGGGQRPGGPSPTSAVFG